MVCFNLPYPQSFLSTFGLNQLENLTPDPIQVHKCGSYSSSPIKPTSIFSTVLGSTMTFCFISNGTVVLLPTVCPSTYSCLIWRIHSSQRWVGLVRGRVVFTEIPTQHTSLKERISGALMAATPVYSGMEGLA